MLRLTEKDLDDFADYMKSGEMEQDFRDGCEHDRLFLLSLLEKFMDVADLADEGALSPLSDVVGANVELGWKSMLYLTLTGRNDWNSRLVNTQEESFFYPSVGLSAIISQMVNLPDWFSYLKVRGSYTEVGAPVSRSGLTPGTITIPIVGGILQETGIYPFSDFKAERTRSYEFGLEMRLWNNLRAQVTYYKSNTYNQTFLGELPEYSGYKQIYLQAGNVENRLHHRPVGTGANQVPIRPAAQGHAQAVHHDGLARAGFAGQHIKALAEFQGKGLNQGDVSDAQFDQHYFLMRLSNF